MDKAREVIKKASREVASAEKALEREQKLLGKGGKKDHAKEFT